jgi:hypothetical protein
LVAAVVENSSTLEAKKTAAAHAVASADNGGGQQEAIEAAVKSPEGLEAKKAVARTGGEQRFTRKPGESCWKSGGTTFLSATKGGR